MNSPFFLTPQIANLMEDFAREISRDSSLFLLYGEAGAGKSRLLVQLKDSRLEEKVVHFVDLAEEDREAMSGGIAALAEIAGAGEVIIFDHFESASNKAQQQIIDSWSTDGKDKKMNFIVCADNSAFNRFRQLAGQFQTEVKSFRLEPCNRAESEKFLQQLIHPDQPFSQLAMNASLKHQLRQCAGLFSRLEELASQHGNSIQVKPQRPVASSRIPLLLVFLSTCLLITGGYIFTQHFSEVPGPEQVQYEVEIADSGPVKKAEELSVQETIAERPVDQKNVQQSDPQPETTDNIVISESAVENPRFEAKNSTEAIDGNVVWLDNLLRSSLEWINRGDSGRGTIQVMSISFNRFDIESLRSYFTELGRQGVDVDLLHLFETRAGKQAVYSLVYGEFTDRHEANRQIGELPESLGASNPIPRSTGSIAREIARISGE